MDAQLGHPAAEAQDLPAVREAAAALGYDEAGLAALIAEVEAEYARDRGRGLVEAAFRGIEQDGDEDRRAD